MAQRVGIVLAVLALLLAACGGGGGGATKTPTSTATSASRSTAASTAQQTTAVRIPNTSPAKELTVAGGFTAYAVAEGFAQPTSIALAPDGTVFVSESGGTVYRLVDSDGDGVFESKPVFASGFNALNGIMVTSDGTMYVSSKGRVTTVRDTNGDGVGDAMQAIITGLPNGRHQNNGLVIGPDGKLYITNGSDCDDCVEGDPRFATILQANPDGSALRVYAHGLRNSYDITFDDQGRFWATDNGSDTPCTTIDELDLIVDAGDYGWPYGSKGCDANTAGIAPVANLGEHTASTGITFYNGAQFPAEYQGNFFVTLWGDLGFASTRTGRTLVRIVIAGAADGPQGVVEQFASGFAHPIDVVADRDGTLLVLDYGSGSANARDGKLYRIVYTGG